MKLAFQLLFATFFFILKSNGDPIDEDNKINKLVEELVDCMFGRNENDEKGKIGELDVKYLFPKKLVDNQNSENYKNAVIKMKAETEPLYLHFYHSIKSIYHDKDIPEEKKRPSFVDPESLSWNNNGVERLKKLSKRIVEKIQAVLEEAESEKPQVSAKTYKVENGIIKFGDSEEIKQESDSSKNAESKENREDGFKYRVSQLLAKKNKRTRRLVLEDNFHAVPSSFHHIIPYQTIVNFLEAYTTGAMEDKDVTFVFGLLRKRQEVFLKKILIADIHLQYEAMNELRVKNEKNPFDFIVDDEDDLDVTTKSLTGWTFGGNLIEGPQVSLRGPFDPKNKFDDASKKILKMERYDVLEKLNKRFENYLVSYGTAKTLTEKNHLNKWKDGTQLLFLFALIMEYQPVAEMNLDKDWDLVKMPQDYEKKEFIGGLYWKIKDPEPPCVYLKDIVTSYWNYYILENIATIQFFQKKKTDVPPVNAVDADKSNTESSDNNGQPETESSDNNGQPEMESSEVRGSKHESQEATTVDTIASKDSESTKRKIIYRDDHYLKDFDKVFTKHKSNKEDRIKFVLVKLLDKNDDFYKCLFYSLENSENWCVALREITWQFIKPKIYRDQVYELSSKTPTFIEHEIKFWSYFANKFKEELKPTQDEPGNKKGDRKIKIPVDGNKPSMQTQRLAEENLAQQLPDIVTLISAKDACVLETTQLTIDAFIDKVCKAQKNVGEDNADPSQDVFPEAPPQQKNDLSVSVKIQV